ncbi:MAG: tRNA uridine-5-carboxymethylaminomethyl(34) synthesis GTPase MnmE [Firmicutes bacterium HGW-Firmicutes-8]|nr:MAG: tRNA uridine-5-carboxymethylaminomethyl(34) synthesis GTPase MnmE [Firmicutes bacterium HGW-Firmicutes-8]
MLDDTIAAISTPIGAAGIGIVRVSGRNAIPVVEKIFSSKKKKMTDAPSHSMLYGHIVDPEGKVVDEVLVSVMRAPHSFTAEDVVEINCHGGVVAVRKTLETVLKAGARPAEPGEFSKRAFLNGRIDLAQAESIMDLISAKTERSLKVAVSQLEGALSAAIKAIRTEILGLLAHIEAGIDFPEHDLEDISRIQIEQKTKLILDRVKKLIDSAGTGKVFREGLKTVIIGKPNVGKSSLLNALLKEKRAIVTDIPGTTRDAIEEIVSLRGIPLKLVDTAGIRETDDIVEKIGVEKTMEMFGEADLVLFMIDASTGLTADDREIFPLLKGKNRLLIINKTDIKKDIDLSEAENHIEPENVIEMSLFQEKGLDRLEERIETMVYAGLASGQEELLVTNIRHKNALEEAGLSIEEVLKALAANLPTDCLAIDLKTAWDKLGEITGETVEDDLVTQIFTRFCIGK